MADVPLLILFLVAVGLALIPGSLASCQNVGSTNAHRA